MQMVNFKQRCRVSSSDVQSLNCSLPGLNPLEGRICRVGSCWSSSGRYWVSSRRDDIVLGSSSDLESINSRSKYSQRPLKILTLLCLHPFARPTTNSAPLPLVPNLSKVDPIPRQQFAVFLPCVKFILTLDGSSMFLESGTTTSPPYTSLLQSQA